jgi:hypothetical protein
MHEMPTVARSLQRHLSRNTRTAAHPADALGLLVLPWTRLPSVSRGVKLLLEGFDPAWRLLLFLCESESGSLMRAPSERRGKSRGWQVLGLTRGQPVSFCHAIVAVDVEDEAVPGAGVVAQGTAELMGLVGVNAVGRGLSWWARPGREGPHQITVQP